MEGERQANDTSQTITIPLTRGKVIPYHVERQ